MTRFALIVWPVAIGTWWFGRPLWLFLFLVWAACFIIYGLGELVRWERETSKVTRRS